MEMKVPMEARIDIKKNPKWQNLQNVLSKYFNLIEAFEKQARDRGESCVSPVSLFLN